MPTLLTASAIWGVTYTLIKEATVLYPAFSFLALRFGLAWLVLLSFARVTRGNRMAPATRRSHSLYLGALLALGYALHVLGLAGASATAAGFITGLLVPLTPLFAATFLSERIGAGAWIAVSLGVFGVGLISGFEVDDFGPSLLLLGGAACFALHIVFTRRFARDDDPMRLVRQQMLVCGLAFACVAFVTEPLSVPDRTSVWVAVVVTGVLGSAVAYTLQTRAQRRTTATRTSLALASEPVFAAVFATLVAGERLGPIGLAGCLAILAAIVVADESPVVRRVSAFPGTSIARLRFASRGLGLVRTARSNREWRERELAL
jgi:drug/metabolite transporter (DMT)-like permease